MGSRKNPQPFLKLPEPFFTVLADAEQQGGDYEFVAKVSHFGAVF